MTDAATSRGQAEAFQRQLARERDQPRVLLDATNVLVLGGGAPVG
jgi:hypothetical protein